MSFFKTLDGELKRNVSKQALNRKIRQARAEPTGAVVKADNGDDFTMKNGFLYTVVRAITARVNQNFDGWPPEELKSAAHTFVGKPVFVNHQNSDPNKARGRVVAARYFENGADKGIECIMEVDAERFPKLAHEIRSGGLDSVSMGAEAGFTICSMCGNKAVDTHDMCDHVKFHKGEHLMKNGSAQLVYETCHKLGFFELSYVFDPADETAVVSKVIQASVPQPKVANVSDFARLLKQAEAGDLDLAGDAGQIGGAPDEFAVKDFAQGLPTGGGGGMRGIQTPGSGPVAQQGQGINAFGDALEGQRSDSSGAPAGLAGADNQDLYGPDSFLGSPNSPGYSPNMIPSTELRPSTAPSGTLVAPPRSLMDGGFGEAMGLEPPASTSPQPFQASVLGIIRQAYGEVEAPESVDTLRQEEPGSEEDFHSYVETPAELRDPNLDRTQQLDREQEAEGLDQGRNVENVEGWEAPDHAMNEQRMQQQPSLRPEDEFLMAMLSYPTPVNAGGSRMNEGRTREDNTMGRSRNSLASRGKVATAGRQTHRKQAEGPLTDGGDHSVDGQSVREPSEDEFLTQTPTEEAVETAADGPISNTENNLVARMKHTQQQLLRDAARYQQMQADKRQAGEDPAVPGAAAASGAVSLPGGAQPNVDLGHGEPANYGTYPEVLSNKRTAAIAQKIAWMKQRLGRELTAEEAATVATSVPETADVVNPPLSGTDDQSLKGSDFQPADPNAGVRETQPQDSKQSSRVWAAFDHYLQKQTGKTARQHGFQRQAAVLREAKRFAQANRFDPEAYFPHLGNVLSQIQKDENHRRANMNRRHADTSLDVAAPGGRIDVEAPTSNTTDAEAQASQFAIDEFGRNAGDGISDPDLSTDYVTWAPGEGKKEGGFKRASTADAVRAADLFVEAGLRAPEDRYNLIAQHEVMRAGQVADRIAMCEGFIAVRQHDMQRSASRQRLAASGVTRGSARQVPPGFGNGRVARTAGRHTSALEDQSTDGLLFM
jgi:hypothetical protein